MTEETKPVTRIRRPVLAQPKLDEPRDQDEVARDQAAADETAAIIEAEEAKAAARAVHNERPPVGAVREEVRREGHAMPITPGFVARDGDVLCVSYAEVTLPLPKQYSSMKFGGQSYTRTLREGDDVEQQATLIGEWLARTTEALGVAKYRRLVAEFLGKVK